MSFTTIIDIPIIKRNFDIEQLKSLSPTPEGQGIKFEEWAILDKDEVLSHTMARELGIVIQTRVGKALFPETIEEISDDIENGKGYNYRLPQPSVSKLVIPVMGTDGKEKKYAVRNGNNRFELPYQEFPCAIISGEEDYDLLRFGCTENNPDTWSKKNDNTPEDVKAMIQIGFECGKIEKTEDAVREELEKNYPKVRNRSRDRFISEILSIVGEKMSFQPYNKKTIKTHLSEHFNLELGEDKDNKTLRVTKGWGRPSDDLRNTVNVLHQCINPDYSGWDVEIYSHLSMGEGVTENPNKINAPRLRQEDEQYILKFIRETCIPIAERFRAGTLKLPTFHWVAQINGKEKLNEFH